MYKNAGLILEGGANRGVFTAGVLDCFQKNEIRLPYVVAVSVGCCCAMDYVSGQPGRTKSCMIPEGRNPYPISASHIFRYHSVVDFDLVFNRYPNEIVPFDYDAYSASDCLCEYVVTNCETGQPEYFSEKRDGVKMMRISRASCSMPYLCRAVKLDGVSYLDGGIGDSLPVRHAIGLGYEKNVVILTRQAGYHMENFSTAVRWLGKAMYCRYPAFVAQMESWAARYNQEMTWLETLEKQGKVFLIRPTEAKVSRLCNDENLLKEFYTQGWEIADRRMGELKRFLMI